MATKVQGGATADPLRKYRFLIYSIDGANHIPRGEVGFSEVDGLGLGDTDATPYLEGNDVFARKLMGRTTWGDITLKKGLDLGFHLERWRDKVIEGSDRTVRDTTAGGARASGASSARCALLCEVHDRSANEAMQGTAMLSFKIEGAWPKSLSYDSLSASDSGLIVATCVLAVDRVSIYSPQRFGAP